MERPGAKEIILEAAQNLKRKGAAQKVARPATEVLAVLAGSLDRSRRFDAVQRRYNVGGTRQMVAKRNAKGKVTLAFFPGLDGVAEEEAVAAFRQALKDFS
jgi:hypothetical protein